MTPAQTQIRILSPDVFSPPSPSGPFAFSRPSPDSPRFAVGVCLLVPRLPSNTPSTSRCSIVRTRETPSCWSALEERSERASALDPPVFLHSQAKAGQPSFSLRRYFCPPASRFSLFGIQLSGNSPDVHHAYICSHFTRFPAALRPPAPPSWCLHIPYAARSHGEHPDFPGPLTGPRN